MESNQLSNSPNEDAVIEALTLTFEIDELGNKYYKNKEGQVHRIHGPAVISFTGTKWWYKNNKRHREDGPAVIFADGVIQYWLNDIRYTKDEFTQWQKDNGIKPIE